MRINPEFKDQRRSRDGEGQMFDNCNGVESLNSNILVTDIVPLTPSQFEKETILQTKESRKSKQDGFFDNDLEDPSPEPTENRYDSAILNIDLDNIQKKGSVKKPKDAPVTEKKRVQKHRVNYEREDVGNKR